MRNLLSIYLISKLDTIFFIWVIVLATLYMTCSVAYAEPPIPGIAAEVNTPVILRPPIIWMNIDALLPGDTIPIVPLLGGNCPVTDVFFTFLDRDQVIVTVYPVSSAEGVVVNSGWAYRDGYFVGPVISSPHEAAVMEISYRPLDHIVHLEINGELFEFDNTGGVVVWRCPELEDSLAL